MTIREREDQIRHLPVETAVAWNAAGVEVLMKTGEKNRIVFTDEELVLLQGAVFTHNQPSGLLFPSDDPRSFGNSFSFADVHLACSASLTEMRVVTPKLRFSLKPPPQGWNDQYWNMVLEPIYLRHRTSVSQELKQALRDGRLLQPEAEARHFHEICRRTALEAGLDYQKEEN